MKALRRAWHRLTGNVARERREAELSAELQMHVDMLTEENLRCGMPLEEAERQARITFGGVESTKEDYRDQRGLPWLETVLQDIRYALRGMRKSPVFTAVAVGCLALGIGANTAIFSVFNAVMLRYLPVKSPEQLVLLSYTKTRAPQQVRRSASGYDRDSFPYEVFETLRSRNRSLAGVAAFVPTGFFKDSLTVTHRGRSGTADGDMVSGNYFPVLGVAPLAGRTIVDADFESGAPNVAVISHRYWKREFGAELSAVGREIRLNRVPFTVVGIAPAEFFGVDPAHPADIWIPLRDVPGVQPWGLQLASVGTVWRDRQLWWCMMIGRLRPGQTAEQALPEANTLFQSTITAGVVPPPRREQIPSIVFTPAGRGLAMMRSNLSRSLRTLMFAAALVLLIACTNVATLLVARARSRQREIGVRLAIGASRGRLIRQLLTESTILSLLGGLIGLLLAHWASGGLLLVLPLGPSSADSVALDVRLDAMVLAFSIAVSIGTGLLFGLAPALRATRASLASQLRESAGGTTSRLSLGRALIAVQVALSCVLLFGAGLFVRTLRNLEGLDLGFRGDNIVLFRVDPARNGYSEQKERELYRHTTERLRTIPGVRSVSFSVLALLSGTHNMSTISTDAATELPDSARTVYWNMIGPEFFQTMGIPIKIGRDMDWRDYDAGRKLVVVSESFAKQFYPNENPIGRRLSFTGRFDPADAFEIVGVARDAKYADLREHPKASLYVRYESPCPLFFEVLVSSDPAAMTTAVRNAMREIDPTLPVTGMRSQRAMVEDAMQRERMFARLGGLFGALALVLVAIGLYGTLSYSVARRTGEIGIRMALGAGRAHVLWMILRESFALALVGVAVGLPLAFTLSRWIKSMLYDVKTNDVTTIVATIAVLALVAAAAGFVPANRASRIEPVEALRCD
jgi:predicted permease